MGSFDGAEICELVGLFILSKLTGEFGKESVGLYRDDGLMLLRGTSGRSKDQARKHLHRLFELLGLKITADVCHQTVNFLDITLNLMDGYQPYRKPNNDQLYINSNSNHSPTIIKQLPIYINKRLSNLSSNKQSFESCTTIYENALKRSDYQHKLHYSDKTKQDGTPKRKRSRNVIWFNPTFSKNIKTNIGKQFLNLIDTHFPPSSTLHRLFNQNTVKISYCCMKNIKTVISNHNTKILASTARSTPKPSEDEWCNCRTEIECPLNGKCLSRKAEVTTLDNGDIRHYTGITSNPFKQRFRNHQRPIRMRSTRMKQHYYPIYGN